MKKITKEEIQKILDDHKLWLETGGEKGKRANLTEADLREANLRIGLKIYLIMV